MEIDIKWHKYGKNIQKPMIYGKNLTAIITKEDNDNTSNIEVIDLLDLPLKVEESLKWFVLHTERLTNLVK